MRDYDASLLAFINIVFKLVTYSKERRRVQIIPIAAKTQRAQPLVIAKTDMKMTPPTVTWLTTTNASGLIPVTIMTVVRSLTQLV